MNDNKIYYSSAEIAGLWDAYISESMTLGFLKCMASTCSDPDIKGIIQNAIGLSEQHLIELTNLLQLGGLPIPAGFGENDYNPNAPKLFMDKFYLLYLSYMVNVGMNAYSLVLNYISDKQVRNYFLIV